MARAAQTNLTNRAHGSPGGLATDPAIPSRDLLLDPDRVAEQLSRLAHGTPAIESCSLRRVKYRIGESLRVVYNVVAGGNAFVMSARTFTNSATAFRQAATMATPVGVMPGVAHDPHTNTVWWTVPNDRKLNNLGTLLDAPSRVRQASGVAWERSTLVEYTPERSATARVLDAEGLVAGYAKAYLDRDALDVANQYDTVAASLASINGVRTPRALGWARLDRIIVLEPMLGVPWNKLPGHNQTAAMRHFGSALAHVHELPTDFGRGPFQRYRLERVLNSADLVSIARPDVAAVARRLSDKLAGGPPTPTSIVCVHGDVQANNVLFHGDQVHMIDFDQGGSGTASADLGSVLASLMTIRLINPDGVVAGLGAALLDGYGSVRALPSTAELVWYTSAACVADGAIRAVNRVYQPTLAVLAELLELAGATLTGKATIDG
ncbi:MAG: phosphotransferase [Actinomycetota bacterium]|nr:phosphotransferase [Actinomycetota bacterium]